MLRRATFAACLLLTVACAGPVLAAETGIAAVVNDKAISTIDLENRMTLAIRTSKLNDSPALRAKLRPQILRALIDENLKLQEADKQGIEVTEKDMANAIANIEKQNQAQPGSFDTYLKSIDVSRDAFLEQLRAQLAWTKLMYRKVSPRVRINEEEVDATVARAQARSGPAEVRIQTLVLPVDAAQGESTVQKAAEELADQLRKDADFNAVTRQFQAGADATEPFWAAMDQMDPVLANALAGKKKGDIAGPVRTKAGFAIVKLIDQRGSRAGGNVISPDSEVALRQIVIPVAKDAPKPDVDKAIQKARTMAMENNTCAAFTAAASKKTKDYKGDVGRMQLKNLVPQVREMVANLPIGKVGKPFRTPAGIHLLMVCERIDVTGADQPPPETDRNRVRDSIKREKLELEALKYLRTLRREAFIEVRG